ncbi:hypothetical protein GQX74_014038 [Glossina fuscipes]|nr:hypothetical protein GQX74_014038 [Glossina fuscipes]
MPLEERRRGGTRGARTNSGVIVGGSMEDVSPPSYAQVVRNNRINTGSNRNDWTNVEFLSGGTLMTDNLVTQSSVIVSSPKVPPLGPEPIMVFCMLAILLRTVREYQTSLRKLWQNFGHLLQRIINVLRCTVFDKISSTQVLSNLSIVRSVINDVEAAKLIYSLPKKQILLPVA